MPHCYGASNWRIVRSVQTVSIANSPYSELIPIVISLLHKGTVCYGSYDPYDLHAWLTRIVNISYKSHKGKQAGSNNNIPRFISHKSKQARFNCNIPCSISRIPKQARFKCNTQWSCSGACLHGNNTMWNWKGGRFVTIQGLFTITKNVWKIRFGIS